MENNFDYESVPYEYAHCFNSQCTRSQKCLHHLVAENSTSQYPTLRVINPNCIPVDTAQCPYFKSTRKLHMAWGVKRLLDNVPYKDGNALRNQLIAHFGKKLLSFLSPGTSTATRRSGIYPTSVPPERLYERTPIRKIQRRILLRLNLRHISSFS